MNMNSNKSVIALGKFDGLHIGHKTLISKAVEIASSTQAETMVYAIGSPSKNAIITQSEKDQILMSMGVDKIIYRTLDDKLKNMSPASFVSDIISDELNASCVVVGEDFCFGKGRSADCDELKRLCAQRAIDTVIIKTVQTICSHGTEDVSSTAIRDYLAQGMVDCASKHLGRPFSFDGVVECGKRLGRKLGFPTINIFPGDEKMVPMHGVYATYATISGREYPAITNVGINPTVDDGDFIKIETHIFDRNIDCYGNNVTIKFIGFIRPEKRFQSVDDLAVQIDKDIKKAQEILKIRKG